MIVRLGALLLAAAPHLQPLSLSDAVTRALTNNPAIQAGREAARSAEGAALIESGPFDFVVDSAIGHRRQYTPYTEEIAALDNVTQFRLGVSKQLPFGLIIEPSIELYRQNSVIPAVVSGTDAPQNVAVVRLGLRQPLLRGVGFWATASRDAAEEVAAAANHEARQIAAERVLAVVAAYWRCAGAVRAVESLREAELRAEQMVKEGRELVAGDQRPRADLEPLEASLADRTRSRLLAEQDALEAKASLGLEMGIEPDQMAALLDPLPGPLPDPVPDQIGARSEIAGTDPEVAMSQRDDVRAAELMIAAADLLVEGAENGALPRLDLQADVGYSGIVAGGAFQRVFEPVARNIPGANFGASLILEWPVENSEARGVRMQAVAERRRAQIQRDDATRRVRTQLALAEQNLRTTQAALERSRSAQTHYRAAVENERTKLRSGHATVIDVILTEDRTSSANLSEIASHVGYAQALAMLAFASGDLIRGEGESIEVNLGRLAAPSAAAAKGGR